MTYCNLYITGQFKVIKRLIKWNYSESSKQNDHMWYWIKPKYLIFYFLRYLIRYCQRYCLL